MTSTLDNSSEFQNPASSLQEARDADQDAPDAWEEAPDADPPAPDADRGPAQADDEASDADVAIALPRASQVVLQAVRAVNDAAESLRAQQYSDLSLQRPGAIVLPTASELLQQVTRGAAGAAEIPEPPQAGDVGFQPPDVVEPASGRLRSSRRRRGYWLSAALATLVVVIAIGADTSIPGAAGRQFGLMAIPAEHVASVEAPVKAPVAIAGAGESGASPADLLNRAAELHVTTVALTSPALPIPTDASEAAPAAAMVETASPPPKAVTPAQEMVRGVTDKEILFGIAAPFSGASRELGRQMRMGVETAFDQLNESGGLNGRQLRLAAVDDGYEPTRTVDAMNQLYDKDRVFGFIGNVGTPTAAVALPFALDHHTLFFGAFSGANLLRRDPPDRYVFNYRASYAEETDAVMRYLVKVRRLLPSQIVVFAQQDSYGDSGYDGVSKALRALPGDNAPIVRLNYKRNTVDVQDAVNQLNAFKGRIKAVVMVASYRAAAKFIEKTRDLYPSMIYTNVSFVGSTALAYELMLLGPRYANGVVVTQVVPAVNSYASIILRYKSALAKYFPGEAPDYVSLEGYIDGMILAEAIRRVGPQINTERLVDELERLRDFDMGLGTLVTFTPDEHQGSHKVWGTQLDDTGHYQPIDLQ
jgi:branched-chain amino acid transport system substrate-binding protein